MAAIIGGVDLAEALTIVNRQVAFPGRSDGVLAGKVRDALTAKAKADPEFEMPSKVTSPADGLKSGVVVRPVEALHRLAYATRPRLQDNLLDFYLQWGIVRYLGFFVTQANTPWPLLAVSDAGKQVMGNQRRVTSEELGIGFGVLLAERWFEQSWRRGLTIRPVDVDVALSEGRIDSHTVESASKRRPDYLLVANAAPGSPRHRIRALECKGNSDLAKAVPQLASAAKQLEGIRVSKRLLSGLAVSTVSANNKVRYEAIALLDENEPTYGANAATMDESRGFRLAEAVPDVEASVLVNALLRSSWATLADFGGNLDAVDRWAPEVMRNRLDRRPRQRASYDTPYGIAQGTSVSFEFNGQRLTVSYGVEETIDHRLSEAAVEDVVEAQAAFAERLARQPGAGASSDPNPREAHSATTDGSIFTVTLD
ncbi:hypothetical protein [Pseudofrankia sp. DC12]|uniref:hypothetical protein n=1 Tax=Pseudofrankia sp. DC12 TaxID=683315 RepID=UPI0005F85378|nr:hypothetical protein [Pseudofrankia sp. DC12]